MGSIQYETQPRSLKMWFMAIAERRLVLPEFQRYEAWEPSKVVALLQSIVEGLPIGSVLILRSRGSEPLFRWRPLSSAPAEGDSPVELLLDGQQRLTALWKALTDSYEGYRYGVKVQGIEELGTGEAVEKEEATYEVVRLPRRKWMEDPAEWARRGLIPLSLMDPRKDVNELRTWRKAAAGEDGELEGRLEQHIGELRQRFHEFILPYIALVTNDPEAALSVFIRTNTKVTRLSPFDLVVAYFARPAVGVNLHELVRSLREEVPVMKAYTQVDDLDILRAGALLQGLRPTNREIFKLDGKRLRDDWPRLTEGARRTFAFLREERIFTGDLLPTEAVVPVLIALWAEVPHGGPEEGNARTLLRQYLWRAFLSDRYDQGTATRAYEDYRALQSRLKRHRTVHIPAWDAKLPAGPEELLDAGWPARKDRFARGVFALLLRGPCFDLHDGAPLTPENLAGREYHHLFPKAYLQAQGYSEKEANRALNCALITWKTNRAISAKDPERYLREAANVAELGEAELARRLRSHLVPLEEFLKGDYRAFLRARAERAFQVLQRLIAGEAWQPGV